MRKIRNGIVVIIALTLGLISMFSAACAPADLVVVAATPAPAPTPTLAPTATIETTPTPTPTINPQDIEETKLNQNILDFLSKAGEYTDEAESNRLMSYNNQKIALGWTGEGDNSFELQGEFLGYIRKGEYLIMAVGFNGTDGLNHVKPIAIPIGFFRNSDGQSDIFPFQFIKLGDWTLLTSHKMNFETSLKGVEERLKAIKGSPVILDFTTALNDDEIWDMGVGRFGETCIPYYEDLKNNSQLPNGLMAEIVVKANEVIVIQKTKYSLSSDIKIPDITSIEDLKNIDISVVPRSFGISSNLW